MRSIFLSLLLPLSAPAFELPRDSTQAVVGLTNSWDSSTITVVLYQKDGDTWQKIAGPWTGRCGKTGLAWGKGIHPSLKGPTKREGDWRTPAGVFSIGGAWGYDASIKKHPKLFYRKVTPRDLWVEDPASPHYNRHLVLNHEPRAAWEKKAQMKQDDYPHSLKLFVAHNAPPKPTPGAGSAIFFHIWRGGGAKPTSGCTTLPEPALRQLVSLINPDRHPLYIALPKPEYDRLRTPWKLP